MQWSKIQIGTWTIPRRVTDRFVSVRELLLDLMKHYPEKVQVWEKQYSLKTRERICTLCLTVLDTKNPLMAVNKSPTWAVCQDFLGNLQGMIYNMQEHIWEIRQILVVNHARTFDNSFNGISVSNIFHL